jgi:hypothetical protein
MCTVTYRSWNVPDVNETAGSFKFISVLVTSARIILGSWNVPDVNDDDHICLFQLFCAVFQLYFLAMRALLTSLRKPLLVSGLSLLVSVPTDAMKEHSSSDVPYTKRHPVLCIRHHVAQRCVVHISTAPAAVLSYRRRATRKAGSKRGF